MSTVIKMIPKEHATKRTTAVIITNDGIIRTRVEDPVGTATDKQFNFSSYAEGTFREINNEPVVSVTVIINLASVPIFSELTETTGSLLISRNVPSA